MYNNKAMEKKEYKKPNTEYIEFCYSAVAAESDPPLEQEVEVDEYYKEIWEE